MRDSLKQKQSHHKRPKSQNAQSELLKFLNQKFSEPGQVKQSVKESIRMMSSSFSPQSLLKTLDASNINKSVNDAGR